MRAGAPLWPGETFVCLFAGQVYHVGKHLSSIFQNIFPKVEKENGQIRLSWSGNHLFRFAFFLFQEPFLIVVKMTEMRQKTVVNYTADFSRQTEKMAKNGQKTPL